MRWTRNRRSARDRHGPASHRAARVRYPHASGRCPVTPSEIATYLAALAEWRANSRWSTPAPTLPIGATLAGATLNGANLTGATLNGATLVRASLAGATLVRASLAGANLNGANLTDANLTGATMPAGYRWEVYLATVVPALLAAGGQSLGDVLATLRASGGWATCHSWTNCPLHVAYGVDSVAGIPALYQWEARQFLQLYDAGLIPEPHLPEAAWSAEGA